MAETLIPVEVTIDDFVPVMSGPDLIDITVLYTTRYTDSFGTTIATRQAQLSAYSLMTAEQQVFFSTMAGSIKQALHLEIVGQ